MEGTHGGRVVKLGEKEVGNCLGVNPRVGQYMGLSEGVRRDLEGLEGVE